MPDAIDALRAQLSQPEAAPQGDVIDQLRASLQPPDTTQMPELAEHGPRVGELTKPGMDWLPAMHASLNMMLTDDPERLAKSLDGIKGITIGRGKDNVPYAEIAGQKYSLNKEGMSTQDVANFATQMATLIPAGRMVRWAAPFLRGGGYIASTLAEGLAGLLGGAGKEVAEEKSAGEQINPVSVGVKGAEGMAGNMVGSVLGTSFGKLFAQGARFAERVGNKLQLTTTAERALKEAGIDPASLDQRTLTQADDLLQAQLGKRATNQQMAQAVRATDAAETGVPVTQGQATGDPALLRKEASMRAGRHGDDAQNIMEDFRDQQKAAEAGALAGVQNTRDALVLQRHLEAIQRANRMRPGQGNQGVGHMVRRVLRDTGLTAAGAALGHSIVPGAGGIVGGAAANAAISGISDAAAAAVGRRAAEKAIKAIPMVGPRGIRLKLGPIGRVGEGLLPAAGGSGASLLDIYGPDLGYY